MPNSDKTPDDNSTFSPTPGRPAATSPNVDRRRQAHEAGITRGQLGLGLSDDGFKGDKILDQ